jgi:tetratricopeptide (TPR) repeat protein
MLRLTSIGNPKYAEAYNNRANAYIRKGQYDKVISDCNKAIELNPRLAGAYYNRGLAYHQGKKQYDKAISDYNRAIKRNPRLARAQTKGQYDKAISDFTKAIEINPSFAKAYNNRGVSYFYKKNYEKAWNDVYKAQNLGDTVHPRFLEDLRQASGRQK